jgi:uncharacterized protein DUF6113
MSVATGKPGTRWLVTGGIYGALFLLGAVQGIIGSFQHSRLATPVPAAALAFCAAILATCLLAGWGTRSVSGALMPALGWVIASFVLSMPVPNGSVIIANTTPGKWYLYGGTASVLAGVALSLGGRVRTQSR